MDLQALHDSIISNAKSQNRVKGQEYYELHHIKPKCLFPEFANLKKHPNNGVLLTAREHFIVHRILARLHPNTKLVHAPWKMACTDKLGKYKVTARTYDYLRKEHARRISEDVESNKKKAWAKGKKQSEDHIKARTESRKQNGKEWFTDETLNRMSKPRTKVSSRKGRKFSTEQEIAGIKKMVETRKQNGSYEWTDEQKLRQSQRLLANPVKKRPLTDAEKQKLKEEKTKPVTCPHCGKVGAMMVMPRWHFDNCKQKG